MDTHSPLWIVLRNYYQCDGFGAAWQSGPGMQNVTKEARATGMTGLPTGEIDLVYGALQCLILRLKHLDFARYTSEFKLLDLVLDHVDDWKGGYASYYHIDLPFAKKVYTRLHTGGSPLPDEAAGSDVGYDKLPCIMELQHLIKRAHRFVAVSDEIYARILALPSVQNKDRPQLSAFAIYTQHLQAECLKVIAPMAEERGLRVMAHVFDSVYVVAQSDNKLHEACADISRTLQSTYGVKVALKGANGAKLLPPP